MRVEHFVSYVTKSQVDEEVNFFLNALKHCGFQEIMRPEPNIVGMGVDRPFFWIFGVLEERIQSFVPHFALGVDSKEDVDKFFEEATKAGGSDNGKPGLRNHYAPNYYAAFVISPGGSNVELVHRISR
ncbi:Glyoxalase/Bleomycin resistance protein/Dihydroxybiphenyl dioxygenase [Xylariales sp. PMI_506]|nr:Glyoxalase/Bleomycin resistance protein/Dihydroxybiphenyl dioxygenase [Xylariales sp. PMI_506]